MSQFEPLTSNIFQGFLGDLFDSLPEGVMVFNHQRDVLYINDKMQELWQFPDGITTGPESLDSIIDKIEDPARFRSRIEEILDDKNCESQDIIKLKDKQVYHRSSKPLIIQGENVGRFWIYRDISKEYKTEQALKESEKRYKELYSQAELSNKKLNLINQIQNLANKNEDLTELIETLVDGLTSSFGYALAGFYVFKGERLHLVHSVGFDGEEYYEMTLDEGIIGRAARTQKPVFVEDVRYDPSFMASTTDVMSEISVPVFDRKKLFGVLNIESKHIKLTETDLNFAVSLCKQVSGTISSMRLYEEVKTQEEQLQKIFELAPISMAITSEDGSFVRVNKAFENLLGYSAVDLHGLTVSDITHDEDLIKNTGWGHRLLSGEITSYQFEKRYIHKNGDVIDTLLSVSLLPTQDSQLIRHIAQIVDLTALKQAERALLQHQKLESIGVLAGGIAHDFNNLLVALKAQSSLALINIPSDSLAKTHLEKANMAADRAAQLTAQLLAYTGQGQFKVEQTAINNEIEENTQLLKVAIPKNVQIIQELDPDLPRVMTDTGQLQQILMNLIINGAEAMEGQAGQVTILTTQAYLTTKEISSKFFILPPPAQGSFVKISVSDNGLGMSQETQSKIFDPFFSTKFTGRGLGLAAVLGIVRSHKGAVRVFSELNEGTTFCVYFPVAEKQNNLPPSESEVEAYEPSTEENNEEKEGVVLLIDDDKFVREAMSDLFQIDNLALLCAVDGRDGIAQLQQHKERVALVILDLSMPGISSEETFTTLRQIKPDLPIFLCSGYSKLKINETFANQQHEGFIAKPFEIDSLLKTVRKYV